MRALTMRSIVASHQKLTTTTGNHHRSWSSYSYIRSCWRIQYWPFYGHWHLKQIGKVRSLISGYFMNWLQIKKKIGILKCCLLLFCATAMNNFSIRLWCVMKSRFYMTTSGNQLIDWTKKNLQITSQSQTCTQKKKKKKGHGHSFVVCCLSDPLQLSESWWNHYVWEVCSANWWDVPKTVTPEASIGQQKELSRSPQQRPTTRCTTKASKVEPIGRQDFASSSRFTWPLSPSDYHFSKHLNNFWDRKHFHNLQDEENAFQEIVESQSTDFYATGIIKLILCWQNVLTIIGPMLVNKDVLEPHDIGLKFSPKP